MQFQKTGRNSSLLRATCTITADPSRARILLVADTQQGAAKWLDSLQHAGFNVEFTTEPAVALQICRRHPRDLRLIVVVESEAIAGIRSTAVAGTLVNARPDLPCVLLPAGATAQDAEVAVRTAMRWTSVAHVSAAAAAG